MSQRVSFDLFDLNIGVNGLNPTVARSALPHPSRDNVRLALQKAFELSGSLKLLS